VALASTSKGGSETRQQTPPYGSIPNTSAAKCTSRRNSRYSVPAPTNADPAAAVVAVAAAIDGSGTDAAAAPLGKGCFAYDAKIIPKIHALSSEDVNNSVATQARTAAKKNRQHDKHSGRATAGWQRKQDPKQEQAATRRSKLAFRCWQPLAIVVMPAAMPLIFPPTTRPFGSRHSIRTSPRRQSNSRRPRAICACRELTCSARQQAW